MIVKRPRTNRRFRFSIRAMLIVTAVLGVVLGLMVRKANNQKRAVAWVEKAGGVTFYDYEFADDDRWIADAEPPGPRWLRELVGLDYLANVASVHLRGSEITDLSPLTKLTTLEAVNLLDTKVSDLSPLTRLTNLRVLWMKNTPVSDLTPLAKLTNLRQLYLFDTNVGDEEVDRLQKALPNGKIRH